MRTDQPMPKTIDEYIAAYPPEVQAILQTMRGTIRQAAPGAGEAIRYGLATFVLKGNLVHFGAFRTHIGFYPTSSGVERFKDELAGYATSKGTVQFPMGQPIPYDLIARITEFRVKENLARAEARRKKE